MTPRSPRSLLPRLNSRRLLLEVRSVERSQQQCEVRLQPSNLQERQWFKENVPLTILLDPPDLSLQCFKCTKSTGLMNLEQFYVPVLILLPFQMKAFFSVSWIVQIQSVIVCELIFPRFYGSLQISLKHKCHIAPFFFDEIQFLPLYHQEIELLPVPWSCNKPNLRRPPSLLR